MIYSEQTTVALNQTKSDKTLSLDNEANASENALNALLKVTEDSVLVYFVRPPYFRMHDS